MGTIYVGSDEPGREFTQEDEETLVLFASQAAQVFAHARRHRDELRARADLETLIDTSPVGVAVIDAKTGLLISVNREARRIVDGLRMPDQSMEQLLELATVRRGDGQEVSLEAFPLAQVLSTSETVRAEEIVIEGSRRPERHSFAQRHTHPVGGGRGRVRRRHHTGHDAPWSGWNGFGPSSSAW